MSFLKILSNLLVTGGILLAFLFVWGLSILAVYRSIAARRIPSAEQFFWIAITIALPVVGAVVYGVARFAGFLTTSIPNPKPAIARDPTELQIRPEDDVQSSAKNLVQEYPPDLRPDPVRPVSGLRFSVIEGPCAGEIFDLDHLPARIGRGIEAEIRLEEDRLVSRQHAELYQKDGGICLRDLGSLHGSSVNGSPARELCLSPGDTITVGDSVIVFARLG